MKILKMNKHIETKVKRVLIPGEPPILTIESDKDENLYVSALYRVKNETETRILSGISEELLEIFNNSKIAISDLFLNNKNNYQIVNYSLNTGEYLSHTTVKASLFDVEYLKNLNDFLPETTDVRVNELKQLAVDKKSILLDMHLNNEDFEENQTVRAWAFRTIIPCISRLIKKRLGLTDSLMDQYLGYNISSGSLNLTVEIPHDISLFEDSPQYEKLASIQELLCSTTQEDLNRAIRALDDESFVVDYSKILSKLSTNNAWLVTRLLSPYNEKVKTRRISGIEAAQMSVLLKTTLRDSSEVEEFKGTFLEINMINQEIAKFYIRSIDGNDYSGIISKEMVQRIKEKNVNFSNKVYKFAVNISINYLTGGDTRRKITKTLIDFNETGEELTSAQKNIFES